ncbi:MAG: bile acid:sodium symporter family protein [Kiritimatiellales bacterium]
MSRFEKICRFITDWFVVWILLFTGWSLWTPTAFLWVLPNIKWMLGVIMFGMGMTLSGREFKELLQRPHDVLAGAAAQYLIMPLLAYGIARMLRLPDALAVGVILLGCCPGGTASNVITFLAKGDVALSVAMTTASTLLSPLLTPTLMFLLAGHWMHIDTGALFLSIVQIVLIPVVLGTVANHFFGKTLKKAQPILPVISIVAILLIVAAIVGKESDKLLNTAPVVFAAVVLHNGGGLLFGWFSGVALKMGIPQRRALSIEVGMQNSGLAVALAVAHFSPEAALPAALFSVWHNISGPLLATVWCRLDQRKS